MKPFIIAAVLGGIIGTLVGVTAGPAWGLLAAFVIGGLSGYFDHPEGL